MRLPRPGRSCLLAALLFAAACFEDPVATGGVETGEEVIGQPEARQPATAEPAAQPTTQQALAPELGEARQVELIARDFAFEPSQLTVEPGQRLRVTLVNRGSAPHNLEFELPTGEVEFEQNLQPGESRTLEFTAPQEPGSYVYYCPVGDHRERGMEGKLLVQAAAAQ